FSGGDRSDDAFRDLMREAVEGECSFREEVWGRLASRLHYVRGGFSSTEGYTALGKRIREIRGELRIPDNVFFHLAAPSGFFHTIVQHLDESGLASSDGGWRRLVVEKPFGEDRDSARKLDRRLQGVLGEERIYRVDHFLGKETVQNMLAFRFANPSFEPIWNRNYVDHVQITVAEDIGVGTRGSFYESTGVVRDMIQNHLLQLLCMTAIEPPVSFDARALRDETVKVLHAVQVTPFDLEEDAVRGQYGPPPDGSVRGYRDEDDVAADSSTATFAALRLTLDDWRWSGVPFYLRTGKRLTRKITEVAIHFRPTPHLMFPDTKRDRLGRNVLAFRLQPQEGILHQLLAKQPGPEVELRPVTMTFDYAQAFGVEEPPRAYAWLIHDVIQGDQRLFARADWIDEAWSIVDPLVERWAETEPEDFPNYVAGSWGPPEADRLLARDGRQWRTL
ncbi:MAG TPA: glucose-6-phosphate dehydrogenase, partial [Longimicrobiales bacterium]|nr:glucose-6-phosphate dehydrogenase [Longimicrobiales bacterium]